jgi:hypothetical protein
MYSVLLGGDVHSAGYVMAASKHKVSKNLVDVKEDCKLTNLDGTGKGAGQNGAQGTRPLFGGFVLLGRRRRHGWREWLRGEDVGGKAMNRRNARPRRVFVVPDSEGQDCQDRRRLRADAPSKHGGEETGMTPFSGLFFIFIFIFIFYTIFCLPFFFFLPSFLPSSSLSRPNDCFKHKSSTSFTDTCVLFHAVG